MFSAIWNKKRASFEGKGIEKEGLKILIDLSENGNSQPSSSNIVQPCSKIIKPVFYFNQFKKSSSSSTSSDDDNHESSPHYCLLTSCHHCHKFLSLDKEVYMYRGDLGFCSVECRDRQIYEDEMEEIEILILASLQQRRRDGAGIRCESSGFSEGFRATCSSNNNPVIFSYI